MSVRWERLFGEPSSFAVRMSFLHDPDGGAAASPEMAASWGAFQIWVRNVNLCAHVDEGETLQYCHWYLLPLLEWLAENWDPLLHEERHPSAGRAAASAAEVSRIASARSFGATGSRSELATQEACFAWQQRHALRSARDGGIFPDVHIRRYRDEIEVSWKADRLVGADDVSFVATEGAARASLTAVADALHEMLENASEWLRAQVPESQRCRSLVDVVESLREPQRSEERAAWLAGLDTSREGVVTRWRSLRDRVSDSWSPQAVEAVFGRKRSSEIVLDGCLASLLFGSANPQITEEDAVSLAILLLESYEESPDDGLVHLARDEPIDVTQRPWQQGYDLAEELLDGLGSDITDSSWGLDAWLAERHVHVSEIALQDSELRAVTFVSAHHAPRIVVNEKHRSAGDPHARRFTLAHGLCHLLHDRSVGTSLAIASGPWTQIAIEQRANAFAAGLLMPLDDCQWKIEQIAAIAPAEQRNPRSLQAALESLCTDEVNELALLEHLSNLGLLN